MLSDTISGGGVGTLKDEFVMMQDLGARTAYGPRI